MIPTRSAYRRLGIGGMEECRLKNVQSSSDFETRRVATQPRTPTTAGVMQELFCSGDLQCQGGTGSEGKQNAIQFAITASSMMQQQNETVISRRISAGTRTTAVESGTELEQLGMKNADCEMQMTAQPDGFAVMVE